MAVKFSNNGKTTLSAGITSSATSISVTDGSVFPTLGSGDSFFMTLEDGSGNNEIVSVTAVSTNTLTVTRAQEGTTARAFSSGDKAENRLTAAGLNSFVSDSGDTMTGDLSVSGTVTSDGLVISGGDQILLDTGDISTYGELEVAHLTSGAWIGVYEGSDSASNRLRFATSGSARLTIDNNGNVGIGTPTPDTLLEVRGADPILTIRDTNTSSASSNATLRLAESGASDTLDAYWDIKADGGQLQFIDNWNEGGGTGTRVVIDDSGQVGLNTTPSSALHIKQGGNTFDDGLRLERSGNTNRWDFVTGGDNNLYLGYNGSSRVVVADSAVTFDPTVVTINRGNSAGDILLLRAQNAQKHSFTNAGATISGSLIAGGSQITSSSATFQNNGFMRTGRIHLHEGDASPTTNDKELNNVSGVLKWDSYTVWHNGNDGSGSGLDADTVDGIQASSFLRSDANDTFTGTLTLDGHLLVGNPSTVTGQGDNNTHFNYQDNGANYIRGTNTTISSTLTVNGDVTIDSTSAYNAGSGMLNVGGSGDGRIQVRHIWGKSSSSTGTDDLWLQYGNNSQHVQIGASGGGNNLYVSGQIYAGGYFGGSTVWHAGNDGGGSGLDADTLDGLQYDQFDRVRNYCDPRNWTVSSGNQSGYGLTGTFSQNGDGNSCVQGADPFGRRGVIWQTRNNDTTSNADGGWNCNFSGLTDDKSYMFVVYVKRASSSTNGTFYFGCHSSGNTLNLSGSVNSNPYFDSYGIGTFVQDRWYCVIGIVQANNDSNTSNVIAGGTYDMTTGERIRGATTYKMANGAAIQTMRNYLYYSTDPNAALDWWGPAVYEINGNEPNLDTLTRSFSNNKVWNAGNDGSGSGLDADTVDGIQASSFVRSDTSDTMSGNLTVDNGTNTTVTVQSDDTGVSLIRLLGDSQGTGRLYVGQSSTYGGGVEYNGDNSPSSTGAGADRITLYRVSAGTYNWTGRNHVNSNDWEFRGNLTAYSSDERLKENIETIPNALNKVCKLRGVTFDWKDDCEDKGFMPTMKHETGVIAQEVQAVIPDAAVPAPFDEDYLTVKYEKITPVLIEAIKELKAEIDELKTQLAEKG